MEENKYKDKKVLYIHGSISRGPKSEKGIYLAERYNMLCPIMQNTKDFDRCVREQKEAIEKFQPDLVIGSSLGGAIATVLAHQNVIKVPILYLAQAYKMYHKRAKLEYKLPGDLPVIFVHGKSDDCVPVDHSIELYNTRKNNSKLILVEDDHRLFSISNDDSLQRYCEELFYFQENGRFKDEN